MVFFFALSSPESVIQRFEQRAHAVDSRGVAEYLRALVATNAIAEYLPDEQSGKPSSLPSLVLGWTFFFSQLSNFAMDMNGISINYIALLLYTRYFHNLSICFSERTILLKFSELENQGFCTFFFLVNFHAMPVSCSSCHPG